MKDKLGVEMPPDRIVVGLAGKPEVQAVADAAERLLRHACAQLSDHVAPVRAV